jgi:carbon monoxide dehydrogenase subunit G
MGRITVTRTVNAPPDVVFRTVADIRQFSKAVPGIVKYEFLSEMQSGVGTRFRQTRVRDGNETATELEVTEFVENDRIRLVADDGQVTIWDTVFAVKAENGRTGLTMNMDANSYKWLAKIVVYFIMGLVRRVVEQDMDSVKALCEKAAIDLARNS